MRATVAGGWYCDSGPEGHFAALVPNSHIQTSQGHVPLCPNGNVLYLRMRFHDGALRIAGQGHSGGGAWYWNGSTWKLLTQQTNGQKVCAFGPRGIYVASSPHTIDLFDWDGEHLHTLPISPGSGGIQYVTDSDEIVLGDARYGVRHGLNESTDLGQFTIGQGNDGGGVRVWDGSQLRELEGGNCTFVNARRDGDSVSAAFVIPGASVFHWLTAPELAALPVVQTGPVIPPVTPPEPEPKPMAYQPIPSQLATVQAVFNRCTPAQRLIPAFVAEAVAWELRQQNKDFYVNQKRGTQGDSEDAISTPHPQGAGGWAIIDILAGFDPHNGKAGTPAWIDQTQATIDGGTVGGGRLPRNVFGAGPSLPVPPNPPNPQPLPPVVSLHDWIHTELPALVAEFKRKRPELGEPGWEWVSFTTYRRFVERWPYDRVFAEV